MPPQISNLRLAFRRWLAKESFRPSLIGLVISPVYIIRRGLAVAIQKFSPEIKGVVLDYGCGSKPYLAYFNSADSYIGLDVVTSGHDHKDSQVDCFFDGRRLPFRDETFDAVVSFEVFEHIFEPTAALQEIRRVVKDGAPLLISTPFAWDEHEAPFDNARYTEWGMKHMLESNGFTVRSIQKSTTYWLAVVQMLVAYLYQHVFPRGFVGRAACQFLVLAPINVVAILLDSILPRRYSYYCNLVVLAEATS